MPKTRRKEAGGLQGQKAAGLLVRNAEGRMLVVPKLRRKGACRGKKQEDWGLRSANAEGRGVAFCPTGLQNDAIFSTGYHFSPQNMSFPCQNTTLLQRVGDCIRKYHFISREEDVFSQKMSLSLEIPTFLPQM
ncbi:Uncharacterised protein [Chlamydia abortus]|nr:Uncharacterised protein [Chlamydia abortus]